MITEIEIEERLKKLRGKIPNVLIEDLRERLLSKMDILTPEQVDKIIERILQTYSGQVERLIKLDKRVEEIGKHIEEIRSYLIEKKGIGRDQAIIEEMAVEEKLPPNYEEIDITNSEKVKKEEEIMEKSFEIPQEIKDVLAVSSNGKARLERIPQDMTSTMIALKWLGFLIDRVGMQNLENILEFYYEIGWISENVLNTLLKYANGTKPHHREPNWRPEDKLTIQDHLISLLFIERLRGVRITREILDSIEREMKVINRILEEVYGV
ncbi:FlaD/FlaE family flagellar protein [Thermococcus barophilus]|uniref:Flagella protein FlaD-like protein n=1 Tax=Thermococcus barophilus (strain DSM 11836 / MP) TaxID=391623 RepID=F0LGX4_THEBM|nr:FlaD/FlaE family flagellar protein [Thermococcus barophilus]ADT84182.1 flagella protein FlaD-like protein [Thermococcus barophilus MP]